MGESSSVSPRERDRESEKERGGERERGGESAIERDSVTCQEWVESESRFSIHEQIQNAPTVTSPCVPRFQIESGFDSASRCCKSGESVHGGSTPL